MKYLVDLFTSWLGSDADTTVQIVTAYRVGPLRQRQRTPKDMLIKFPSWSMKIKVQENFRQDPKLIVDGVGLSSFPVLSLITIHKRRNLKFVTKLC